MRNAILAGPGRSPGDPPGGARLDVLSPEEMGRADALAPLMAADLCAVNPKAGASK